MKSVGQLSLENPSVLSMIKTSLIWFTHTFFWKNMLNCWVKTQDRVPCWARLSPLHMGNRWFTAGNMTATAVESITHRYCLVLSQRRVTDTLAEGRCPAADISKWSIGFAMSYCHASFLIVIEVFIFPVSWPRRCLVMRCRGERHILGW